MTLEQCNQAFTQMSQEQQHYRQHELPPLRAHDLMQIAKMVGNHKSPGLSSWRPGDLKNLPVEAFEQLCSLFAACEHERRWPVQLLTGVVTFLPKEEATILPPDKVRPISVLPLVLRLYLSLRAKHLSAMLDQKLLEVQWGGRPMRGVQQPLVLTDVAVDLAKKRLHHPCYLAQIDLQKYFNNVAPEPLLDALQQEGVPLQLVASLKNLYSQMVYVNKYHSGILGPKWRPHRGLPQGDPCAVLLSNWYMRTLILAAGVQQSAARETEEQLQWQRECHVFLDDITLMAASPQELQEKIKAWWQCFAKWGYR